MLFTVRKVSKYEVFSGPYFPVFSPNTGKYGPEKPPYLDTFHAAIKDRLDQVSFNLFSDIEQLLLKSINGEDYQQELDNFLKFFVDDIDPFALSSELSIISSICKDGNPAHFDVLSILKALSTNDEKCNYHCENHVSQWCHNCNT